MIVQIYEIQTPREAEALLELGVDHIGSVIISEDQWRLPDVRDTIETVKASSAKSSLIPLYNDLDSIFRTLDYYQPNIVHFCEALADHQEIRRYCEQLIRLQEHVKKRFPEIKVMRSIPIGSAGRSESIPTLEFGRWFEPVSDFFLTDTLLVKASGSEYDRQPIGGFVGITGQTCDWDMARSLVDSFKIPVILAGGMSPQNVSEGIRHVKPAGVDSCTLTNAVDNTGRPLRFKKDLHKIQEFMRAVKRAIQEIG